VIQEGRFTVSLRGGIFSSSPSGYTREDFSCQQENAERTIRIVLALRNKQLLALLIVTLIATAVISFLLAGMVVHSNMHHVIAGVIWGA
jgi:hypothetical protein